MGTITAKSCFGSIMREISEDRDTVDLQMLLLLETGDACTIKLSVTEAEVKHWEAS